MAERVKEAFANVLETGLTPKQNSAMLRLYEAQKAEIESLRAELVEVKKEADRKHKFMDKECAFLERKIEALREVALPILSAPDSLTEEQITRAWAVYDATGPAAGRRPPIHGEHE